MIESFFHGLEREPVHYLLISGQAAILYGGATFSEDIDLWIDPQADNLTRFMQLLRSQGARYHKLTPPMTLEHLRGGHGFHYVLPGGADAASEVFLDVLGLPPRVPSFASSPNIPTRPLSCRPRILPDAALSRNQWPAVTSLRRRPRPRRASGCSPGWPRTRREPSLHAPGVNARRGRPRPRLARGVPRALV